jgi:hypothetical protein
MLRQIMTFVLLRTIQGPFSWSATYSWTVTDFQEFLVPIEIITILTFLTIQSLFRWSVTDYWELTDFQEFLVLMQIMTFKSKNALLMTKGSLKVKNVMICNGTKHPESLRFSKN